MIADYLNYRSYSEGGLSSTCSSDLSSLASFTSGSSVSANSASSSIYGETVDRTQATIAKQLRLDEIRENHHRVNAIEPHGIQFGEGYPGQTAVQPANFGKVSQLPTPLPGRPRDGYGDIWAVNGPPLSSYAQAPNAGAPVRRAAVAAPSTAVACYPPGFAPPAMRGLDSQDQPINLSMCTYAPPANESFVPSFASGVNVPQPSQEVSPPASMLQQQMPQVPVPPPAADVLGLEQKLSPTIDMGDECMLPEGGLGNGSSTVDCNDVTGSGGDDSDSEHSSMPSCRLHARLRKTRLRPENSLLTGKRKYRCELCTMTLEAWVENNGTNPDSPHKTELLKVVGMKRKQLNYWFANRRRMERQLAKDPNRGRVPAFQRCGSEQGGSTDPASLGSLGSSWSVADSSGFLPSTNTSMAAPSPMATGQPVFAQSPSQPMFANVFNG